MRSFVIVALLFSAAVACGGHLDTDPDGGSKCPSNATGACSQNGATCSFDTKACGEPVTENCTCMNGSWSCPIFECPMETCPSDPYQGETCSTHGMSCPSNILTSCSDVMVTCSCNGHQFDCPIPDCPPPLPCPPPDQIIAGQTCNSSSNQICFDGDGDGCFCQGKWQCEGMADAGPPDAGDSD